MVRLIVCERLNVCNGGEQADTARAEGTGFALPRPPEQGDRQGFGDQQQDCGHLPGQRSAEIRREQCRQARAQGPDRTRGYSMTEIYWNAVQVRPGNEREVQKSIEDTDRPAFVPTHLTGWQRGKYRRVREYALTRGYVFFAAPLGDAGWSKFTHNAYGERRARVLGRVADEERVAGLMLAHATGAYNSVQTRQSNGQFGPKKQFKQKKRRRRPRHSRRLRNSTQFNHTPSSSMTALSGGSLTG